MSVNISERVKGSPQKEFKTAYGEFIILIKKNKSWVIYVLKSKYVFI